VEPLDFDGLATSSSASRFALASQEQIIIHQRYSTTTATPGFSIPANLVMSPGKADASWLYFVQGNRVASAANTDALFIKFNPYHTRWIVRPWRQ
jgi:hypothetical protein